MNVFSPRKAPLHDPIALPLTLLAIDPTLGGLCLWGPRSSSLDWVFQWLLRQRMPTCKQDRPGQGKSTCPSSFQSRANIVRLPANATAALVQWPPLSSPTRAFLTMDEPDLLRRAECGLLVIEAADLLAQRTAVAFVRSVGRMPAPKRPLIIARSEQHPSDWPLIAQRVAFWIREPESFLFTGDVVPQCKPFKLHADDVIAASRRRLSSVGVGEKVIKTAVQKLKEFRLPSLHTHQLDLFVVKTARALAALEGCSTVRGNHIEHALQLVIDPRAQQFQTAVDSAPPPADERRPQRGEKPDKNVEQAEGQKEKRATASSGVTNSAIGDKSTSSELDDTAPSVRSEAVDETKVVVVPPARLFATFTLPSTESSRKYRGGGRPLHRTGPAFGLFYGRPPGHLLALSATIQAALPWQRLRAAPSEGYELSSRSPLRITKEDLRSYRRRPRPKVLYILAVDGSGSMARDRMHMAKAAALAILAGAYKERRYVSLIDFRGTQASLLVPPGRNSAAIRDLLTALPSGGGTPLPAALALTRDVAWRWLRTNPEGKVHLVLFTDGKANVPLQRPSMNADQDGAEKSPALSQGAGSVARREAARRDISDIGEQLQVIGVDVTIIDSNPWRPGADLHDIARILNGRIVHVNPRAERRKFPRATKGIT